MKSFTPTATSLSNSKTFLASLLTCIMLVAPLTPIGFASTNRLAPVQSKGAAKQTPPQKADPVSSAAPRKQKERPVTAAAVGITATKTDNRTASQPVGPTDTINYTVTITNNGSTDALGVIFTDSIDSNTTLVPGSIQSTPIANPDTFNVIGNVRIQPNATQGLLANDFNPDNGDNNGITASGPTTSAQNGNVVINPDGSFSYNPAPGFTGTDSFTYTITNTTTNKTDTSTVTLLVGNGTATPGSSVIWFINNTNAATPRDGRITNPFNSIAEFNSTAADEVGDIIFIYTGTGAYTGPLVLLNNQQLIGQGVSVATATGFTVPAYSDPLPGAGAAPTINSAAAAGSNTVTLNGDSGGNTIRGVTLGNASGSDIAGNNFGTLTVSDTTINGTGRALSLSNGTLAATFLSISSSSSPSQGITLSSISGSLATPGTTISGNLTQCVLVSASNLSADFGNTSCTGGTDGISLQNNSGTNVRTFGTLSVSGGSGNAFLHATGGGNTNVTGAASLSSNNNPIEIQNAGNGQTISFSGGATVTKTTAGGAGVNWGGSNTGATLNFASLGITTSNGSGLVAVGGGTINVTDGTISATGSAGQVAPAINANAVTLNATFSSVSSTNSGNSGNGILLTNVPGSLTMNGGAISGAAGDAFRVNGGTANITYNGTISTALARPVNVDNKTGGTVAFGGAVSSTSNGVFLNNNAGATINFTGGLSLSTGANTAFTATGGGTVNATQNNTSILNTVTTTTGTGVNIVTPTDIGASGVTFRSVSVNGAPSGIILNGTSGAFSVVGDGSFTGGVLDRDGSGGILNNTTDDAVRLTSASNVTLRQMNLTSPGDTVQPNVADNEAPLGEHGIEANGGGNIIVSGVLIDSPSGSGMIALNLTGTSRLNLNSLVTNIDNPQTHGLFIKNNNINMTLFEVNDTDFTNSDSGATTLNVKNEGTANMTVEVRNGCIFEALNNQAVTMDGGASAGTTGTLTSLVSGNIFRNAVVSEPAPGVFITSENNVAALVVNGATHNATIENNSFNNIAEDGRIANTSIIRTQNNGGKLNAIVRNNTIQNINYQAGAAGRHVIGHVFEPIAYNAANFSNLRIEGNSASNVTFTATNREFIFIDYREHSSGGDIKILGNNWNMPTDSSVSESVELRFRPANASTIDVQMDNNGNGTGAIHSAATRFLNIDVEESATANLTITNNKFTNLNASPGPAIDVATEDNAAAGSGAVACANISGNVLTTAGNNITLNEAAGTTLNVTQTQAGLTAANAGATVTVVGSPAFGQPACALPSNLTFFDKGAETGNQPDGTRATQAARSSDITSAPFVSLPQQAAVPVREGIARFIAPQAPVEAASNSRNTNRDAEDKAQDAKAAGTKDGTIQPSVADFPMTIGTLGAGKSVTITFSVTVKNPLPSDVTQISNQGTVSGSNFSDVLTDDPDEAGASDPTVTAVIPQPTITINNASAPEPASGSEPMLFTVTLSGTYTVPVTVNYQTADGTATQPGDYTAASGTLTFNVGETFKTVPVPVNADGDAAESDETFTLTLSAPVSGTINGAGVGTGTITAANPPGTVLISELRTSGPGGADDEFVELYNNQDVAQDISGWAIVKSGATCDATPVVVAIIPPSTTIPARGHYLVVGPSYSLGTSATPNLTIAPDLSIEDDRNVGLFNTSLLASLSTATREDAVGFFDGVNGLGGNCDLLREGTPLNAAQGSTSQYSFFRKLSSGKPQDTGRSVDDFQIVSTTPSVAVGFNNTPALGAPGPENLAAPVQRNATIKASLIDPMLPTTAPPNRVRSSFGANPTNAAYGTLSIQRRFKNTLGVPVTRLRFRVVDLTTINNRTAGDADLRVLSSTGAVTNSANTVVVTVKGLTLEAPMQPNGGGLNSTLTVDLEGGLAPGATIDVQFLLGVQEQGGFSFFVNVEALPGHEAAAAEALGAMKSTTTGKQRNPDAGGAAAPQKQ